MSQILRTQKQHLLVIDQTISSIDHAGYKVSTAFIIDIKILTLSMLTNKRTFTKATLQEKVVREFINRLTDNIYSVIQEASAK